MDRCGLYFAGLISNIKHVDLLEFIMGLLLLSVYFVPRSGNTDESRLLPHSLLYFALHRTETHMHV